MSEQLVNLERRGAVAVLELHRPERRNALNKPLVAAMRAHLEAIEDDKQTKAVVFTGAGPKAFAAGADINQLAGYAPADGLGAWLQRFCDYIEQYPKPTLAAVNGLALGGGCELAMACDLRLASRTARFGLPETALGVLPGAGGTQRLARLAGAGRAMDLVLTGRIIDAGEALSWGLVTRLASPEALLDEACAVAEQILSKGPLAVQLAKLVVRQGAETDQGTGLALERLAQALLYSSEDKTEGTSAFLEKRPAEFTGR